MAKLPLQQQFLNSDKTYLRISTNTHRYRDRHPWRQRVYDGIQPERRCRTYPVGYFPRSNHRIRRLLTVPEGAIPYYYETVGTVQFRRFHTCVRLFRPPVATPFRPPLRTVAAQQAGDGSVPAGCTPLPAGCRRRDRVYSRRTQSVYSKGQGKSLPRSWYSRNTTLQPLRSHSGKRVSPS